MADITSPLNIYVMWHPSFAQGKEYANTLFTYYNHDISDPLSRGIGIPVHYRTGEKIAEIDLNKATYNAIIIMVDDEMIIDELWKEYIDQVIENVLGTNGASIIFPVAISKNAFKMSNKLPNKNFIRLYEESNKTDFLIRRTTHELCRLLYNLDRVDDVSFGGSSQSSPPLKLFISHAKEDGVGVAKDLSDYVQSKTALKTFFDANDIAIGYDFTQEIENYIQNSVLLVIHSDKYSSREWCRREVLIAKRYNRPIVIVNVYDEGEDRSFPYMSNLKTIRYNSNVDKIVMYEKIILLTLKETLRFKYNQLFIRFLADTFSVNIMDDAILSYPPELLSVLHLSDIGIKLSVYPDPPLSEEELEILEKSNADIKFFTPNLIPLLKKFGEHHTDEFNFLNDMNIGISISESQNIERYGFEQIHLQDMLVEFTRYLLVSGASLSYGGDVKFDGKFNFAKILFDLARNYQKDSAKPSGKITNFVSYPLYTQLTSELRAELSNVARFVEVPPPSDLFVEVGDDKRILKAETAGDLYVWARCLTKMREEMNNQINARIMLGGRTTGFKGRYPGVVEEAYLALSSKTPLYLVGSMGGASRVIIESLIGNKPQELTEEFQFGNPSYREFYEEYNQQVKYLGLDTIDYTKLVNFFNDKGISGLNNGLSEDENMRLFYTTNATEMISLVLKGLLNQWQRF